MRGGQITIRERKNRAGTTSFCVDGGIIDGKRYRKFFRTKKEAQDHGQLLKKEQAGAGLAAMSLSLPERLQAQKALLLLRGTSYSLVDAAEFLLKHKPTTGRKLVQEVAEELLQRKEANGSKPRYLKELRCKFRRFSEPFGNRVINDLTPNEIERWLLEQEVTLLTRKNYIRDLSILFTFAAKQGYSALNPFKNIEAPKPPQKETEILTVSECQRLLLCAEHSHQDMVAALCIGLFAGLRTCEIERLSWEEVNLIRGFIEVKSQNAKTGMRRIVTISDNLLVWLKKYEKFEGKVAPKNFFRRRKKLCKQAEIELFPNNALRHSFGSYHFAHYANANKTAVEMGHQTTKMLYSNYRQVVDSVEANSFWKIVPCDHNGIIWNIEVVPHKSPFDAVA